MARPELADDSPLRIGAPPAKSAPTKAFARAARSPSWQNMRHPIRMAVMGIAAMALTWNIVGALGAVSSGIAAAVGVLAGEWFARSKLKLVVVVGGAVLGLVFFWWLSRVITSVTWVATLIGPGEALSISVVTRFAAFALWPVLALRAVAVRRRAIVAVEVLVVTGAIAVLFSAHRGGIISRPFWLSDWAWRAGLDPAHVLLVIGGLTVVVLTALMIAETGRRITWMSALALPLSAAAVMTFMDLSGLPKPRPDSELGLTEQSDKNLGDSERKPQPSAASTQPTPPAPSTGPSAEQDIESVPSVQLPDDGGDAADPPNVPSDPAQTPESKRSEQQRQDSIELNNKSAPLAVVLLGDDYAPPAHAFYFRQEVLSEYNGTRLVAARRSGVDRDTMNEFPTRKVRVEEPPPKELRKKVRAEVALLVPHTQPFGLETPVLYAPRPNPNPQRFVRAYRFVALAQDVSYGEMIGRDTGNPDWDEDVRKHYVRGSTDPRFGELAREIVQKLPADKRHDPFLAALVIKRWMDRELVYSTSERHAGVRDPTAAFLFGNRIGYCVHFAHAAVFMWRSLGIPSRMATGYMVSEDGRQGSSILIRSGDAHAWPELYLRGVGWVVLDIAAERNLDPVTPPSDKDLQRKLAEIARQKPPEMDGADDMTDQPWATGWPNFWLVLLELLLAAVLVLYLIKIWRRVIPVFAGRRSMTRVTYRLALDLLAEVGLTREYGEPREHFARRIHAQVPSFTELTSMHLAVRWGDPSGDVAEREVFSRDKWKEALRRLRRERKTVARATIRVLSALNPASFVASR